jgi:hypothetical protein
MMAVNTNGDVYSNVDGVYLSISLDIREAVGLIVGRSSVTI